MDPLAQFKQGKSIETQKSSKEIAKDNEYSQPLNVSFNEQKSQLNESLYGKKRQTNDGQDSKIKELNQNIGEEKNIESKEEVSEKQKIDENPYTPLIDSFIESGKLTVDEGNKIKKELIKSSDNEKNLKDIKGIDRDKIGEIINAINYLDTQEAKNKGQEKFNKDFGNEIDGLKIKVEGSKTGEKELVGVNKDMVERLGSNYFVLESSEGNRETQKQAINRAFHTTLNQLMEGKNFKRPDNFESMKNTVKNSELDFKTRFKELLKINKLITEDQSRANGKQALAFKKYKEGENGKIKTIKERFDFIKQEIELVKKQKDNNEKLKELLAIAEELKEDSEASGDVFTAGEVDVILKDLSDNQNEQKEQA